MSCVRDALRKFARKALKSRNHVFVAVIAAVLTLWVTFIPCFLTVFLGTPYVSWLGEIPRLSGALSAITAAVVGVILNLSLRFALHELFTAVIARELGWLVLWAPVSGFDWRACAIAALSADLLLWRGWAISTALGVSAASGLLLYQL